MNLGQQKWRAGYYDGRTATRHTVTVGFTRDGIRITREDGSVTDWFFADLHRPADTTARRPMTRLELGAGGTEALLIEDQTFWQALREVGGPETEHLTRRHGITPTALIVASTVAVGAIVGLYFWGIPALATSVAASVPLEWEERLGANLVDNMVVEGEVCQDSLALGAVEQIVNRLMSTIDTRYTFRVQISNDGMINAFAAPGGYIVVYAGLLEATKRPEELGGVLAHEIAHVTNQHGTQAALRQIPIRLILAAATGEIAGVIQLIGTVGLTRYSRGDESEADQSGMAIMQDADVDPQGMIDVYRTLEREGMQVPGVLQYLSTHPRTGDRIEQLQGLMEDAGAWTPLLPAVDWDRVRTACGGVNTQPV